MIDCIVKRMIGKMDKTWWIYCHPRTIKRCPTFMTWPERLFLSRHLQSIHLSLNLLHLLSIYSLLSSAICATAYTATMPLAAATIQNAAVSRTASNK